MKRLIVIGLSLFCVSIFFSPGVFAKSKADKILGERASCLDIVNISETKIIDDQTILFETYGGQVYINRLPAVCFNLKSEDAFSYETSLDRLCKEDFITVLVDDSSRGATCGLGKFIQIKGVKRIREAVKLLMKDGALKALVEEGVFEEAFPSKKSK